MLGFTISLGKFFEFIMILCSFNTVLYFQTVQLPLAFFSHLSSLTISKNNSKRKTTNKNSTQNSNAQTNTTARHCRKVQMEEIDIQMERVVQMSYCTSGSRTLP